MSLLGICQWIHQTPVSLSIRESIWIYPILEVLHCVGILLVAGTIVVVDLRLLGCAMRRASVSSVIGQVSITDIRLSDNLISAKLRLGPGLD